MPYKRPYYQKDLNPTALELNFGEKNFTIKDDPSWLSPNLAPLHEDSVFALHQLKSTLTAVIKLDLRDYKEDVAKEKRIEPIRKARQAMLTFLAKHIYRTAEDVNRVKNAILRVTEPETPLDQMKAMLQVLRYQEIREIIRSTDIRKRPDLVRDKPEFLQALINSPDELISPKHLEELRRDFAFKVEPSLSELERDTVLMHDAIRTRAAEVNACAVSMIREMADIDDVITPIEHFQTFPPRSPHEQAMADRMIHDYERKQTEITQKQKWENRNKGVNFEIHNRQQRQARR